MTGKNLISQIDEYGSADIGQPDEQFLIGVTRDEAFMIGSDKILTIAEPTPTLLEKYLDLTKE